MFSPHVRKSVQPDPEQHKIYSVMDQKSSWQGGKNDYGGKMKDVVPYYNK